MDHVVEDGRVVRIDESDPWYNVLIAHEVSAEDVPGLSDMIARMNETHLRLEWEASPDGVAWRAAQLAEQNARPVELAVYKGDSMVAFKSGGFASRDALSGILPDNWDKMAIDDLKDALYAHLSSPGAYRIVTSTDGLTMTHGEAAEIFNRG
ncbi:hypothetical protein [uncultured Roseobacter sp.]|uniref:hypothetical protein n=1 Tax=uncultured Roseobacter sp. TaxID=114847 RepID=UPI00260601BC|nr:hypothetical protein [uncultured Roseobacter sp.]